ncbi:MAG: hypothetical protein KTR33_07510 [Gammaproteobacteria bacterium]|nr:hypothetical protein [Gammaproteobacteria bacterium]
MSIKPTRTITVFTLSLLCAATGWAGTSAARDNIPPTVPGAFEAQKIDQNAVRLQWENSDDNFGVERYHLMRNGAVIARLRDLSYVDVGLEVGVPYTYDVMADDGENYSYVSRIVVTLPASAAAGQTLQNN